MTKKHIIIIAYVVSFGVMYALFNKVDFSAVLSHLSGINPVLLALALAIAVFFRLFYYPLIWKRVLENKGVEASFRDVFTVNATSLPLKFATPLKISELVRAAGMKVFAGTDFSSAFGSIVLMKTCVIVATFTLLLAGAFISGNTSVFFIAAVVVFASLALILSLGKFLTHDFFGFNTGKVTVFLKDQPLVFKTLAAALLMQSGEVLNTYILITALGFQVPFAALMYSVPLMMAFSMIPVSVQGIGVREAVSVASFGKYMTSEIGLSLGILLSLVHHIFPAFIGLAVWIFDSTGRVFGAGVVNERLD